MFCGCVRWLRLGWPARGPWADHCARLQIMLTYLLTYLLEVRWQTDVLQPCNATNYYGAHEFMRS